MSWDDLEAKTPDAVKQTREKQASLAKNYHACFTTNAGKVVLDHLVQSFIMTNDTPFNSPNVEFEAGYHAGEAGLVKMILNQLKKAQEL